jgi:rhodanese-related sulfurtransferase
MGFLGNTERIVTRTLAIGLIAVAAGAGHSWMRGSLNPKPRPTQPADAATNQTGDQNAGAPGGEGQTDPESASNSESPQSTGENAAQGNETAQLPEGHLTVAESYALWESGEATFLDTRAKDEFEAGHVMGAINLSLAKTRDVQAFQEVLMWIPDTNAPLVLYCVGGLCDESEYVGRILRDAGYTRVYIMHDGYPGWTGAGHPTEEGPGE